VQGQGPLSASVNVEARSLRSDEQKLGTTDATLASWSVCRFMQTTVVPPDLARLYEELQDEFDWLRRKWSEFQELFGKGQERIDLLNTVASNFFYFLHRLFFEDAMLHLCRLTDWPQSAGRDTLTVMALADVVSDPTFKASVQAEAKKARDSCQFARKWRNRRLAHADLLTLRQGYGGASTLPPVNGPMIDEALKAIGGVLDLVGGQYGLPHFGLARDPWGARSLLTHLERAKRAFEDERQGWRDAARKGIAQSNVPSFTVAQKESADRKLQELDTTAKDLLRFLLERGECDRETIVKAARVNAKSLEAAVENAKTRGLIVHRDDASFLPSFILTFWRVNPQYEEVLQELLYPCNEGRPSDFA
jgi:AbiU2